MVFCVSRILLTVLHLGFCWFWRDCSSQGWLIPRDSNWLSCEHTFHMQTNQSRAHTYPISHLVRPLIGEPSSCCPNITPGVGIKQLGGSSSTPEPWKWFRLAHPICWPVSSCENHVRTLACTSPSLLSPACPWCFPFRPHVVWDVHSWELWVTDLSSWPVGLTVSE